jgi:trehalose-6-phosphate synthase
MPYITTDPQEFFFKYHNNLGIVQLPIPSDSKPLALSDLHPVTYVQTSSPTSSPPLSSILKYPGVDDKKYAHSGRRRGLDHNSGLYSISLADAEWTVEPAHKGNGGLRNAVWAAHENGSLQDRTWVGTLGIPTDLLEDTPQRTDIEDKLGTEFDSLVVFVKDSDFDGHYDHYCKQVCSNSSPAPHVVALY